MRGVFQLVLLVLVVAIAVTSGGEEADGPLKDDHLTDISSHLFNRRVGRGGHGYTGQLDMDPCPVVCQFDYRPVCGSDGQTYSNRCELTLTACRQKKRVFVEKEGECNDNLL